MSRSKNSVISYLAAKAYEKNIPVYSIIELTKRCNLSCRHCYITEKEKKTGPELSLSEIAENLKQLKKLGVLFLTFTGGEVFLRPDLFEIIALARKLNFDVRIFTNAVLIDAEKAKFLKQYGVSADVSIYGERSFHDGITGVSGSFDMTLRGVDALISCGIKPHIKCVLFDNPEKQYRAVRKIALSRKLSFTFDPVISGEKRKKYTIKDNNIPFIRKITEIDETGEMEPVPNSPLFPSPFLSILCGAGKNMLAIDSWGNILPCLAMDYRLGNIKKNEIGRVWKSSAKLKKLRDMKLSEMECCGCDKISSCIRCPGVAIEESGSIYSKSPSACKIMLGTTALRTVP